jgi:hypothetical protein
MPLQRIGCATVTDFTTIALLANSPTDNGAHTFHYTAASFVKRRTDNRTQ